MFLVGLLSRAVRWGAMFLVGLLSRAVRWGAMFLVGLLSRAVRVGCHVPGGTALQSSPGGED